jgi:hypothetical protein
MELRHGYCADFAGQSNHGTYLVVCLKRKAMKATAKPEGFMVADAVYIEPVSATEFPANREINRENRKKWAWATTISSLSAASMEVFIDIPGES